MSNLRFIERDGKMVLQERFHSWAEWTDVPTHKEPNREVWNGPERRKTQEPKKACDCSSIHPMANIWNGSRCEVCGSMRPPKVDMLVEELAHGFRNHAQLGGNYEWALADYAVKFFKARMPKREFIDHYSQVIYNQALKDVRKALFGEE